MVIYPKIAVVSQLDTVPFVYGIKHADSLCANLLLFPSYDACTEAFREGKADIALLPATLVPSLHASEIITDYCIGATGAARSAVVVGNTPINKVRRIFVGSDAGSALMLAAWLSQNRWHIAPDYFTAAPELPASLDEGDALLLTGNAAYEYAARFTFCYDIAKEWFDTTHQPLAFDVWVGRKGISYEVHDALQSALTFGIEHTFEAVAASDYATTDNAYNHLISEIDFLFDIEKHTALQQLWECGLKVAPKVNPG